MSWNALKIWVRSLCLAGVIVCPGLLVAKDENQFLLLPIIPRDFDGAAVVARLTMRKASPDIYDGHLAGYILDGEVVEVFKGAVAVGDIVSFGVHVDEPTEIDPAGKDWVVFLEEREPLPASGKRFIALEWSIRRAVLPVLESVRALSLSHQNSLAEQGEAR